MAESKIRTEARKFSVDMEKAGEAKRKGNTSMIRWLLPD